MYKFHGGFVQNVDTALFKYESDNRELLLYSDEEGEFYSYTRKYIISEVNQ